MTKKKKSIRSNLIILGISIVLTLIVLEVFLRVVDTKRKQDYRENVWTYIDELAVKSENKELIYKMRPGFSDGNIFFNKINAHGYRDYEHSFEKPEKTFRIVMIGDSVTYGYKVELENTFSAKLQWLLNENDTPKTGINYEIIILAQPSYSISQDFALLRDEAYLYDPDLIIWNYVLNDPAHPYLHDEFGSLATYMYQPDSYLVELVYRQIFYFNEKMKAQKLGCNQGTDFVAYIHCVYWDKVEFFSGEIAKKHEEKGIPIVMAIHPMYAEYKGGLFESFDNYKYKYIHEDLKSLFSSKGLSTLDLFDHLSDDKPSDVAFDLVHPNIPGNKIIGDVLNFYLHENGFITTP